MSVRVIASWGAVLVLVAAFDKVSTQAATPSPALDARRASYELQENCARDAREWYDHWRREMYAGLRGPAFTEYRNHYSGKYGRCFVWLHWDDQLDAHTLMRVESLVDVLENRAIGSYTGVSGPQPLGGSTSCEMGGTPCSSPQEWPALIKPYMED